MMRKTLLAAMVASQCLLASTVVTAQQVQTNTFTVPITMDELRALNQEQLDGIIGQLSAQIEDERMSMVEVFLESNDIECLDLWIEGLCLWMIVKVTPLGVSVSFEFTPRISHYNPDFVVASYPRIGASPIVESDILYEKIQTVVSKITLDLLTDNPIPEKYENEDEFGGRSAESQAKKKSIAMYSETDVIGHPGNVVTLIASGGDLFGDVGTLVAENVMAAGQIAQESQQQAGRILNELSGGSGRVLPSTAGNVSEWQNRLGFGGGDVEQWEDQIALPAQLGVSQLINTALDSFGAINDAIDTLITPGSVADLQNQATDYLENIDEHINDAVADSDAFQDLQNSVGSTASTLGLTEAEIAQINGSSIDSDEVGTAAVNHLREELDALSDEEISDLFEGALRDELTGQIDEFTEAYDDIGTALQGLQSTGVSMGGGLPGFCPRDTSILTPHYLSGLNVLSWRYQLPELAYPQSYAFPIPGSEYFVGSFNAGALPAPTQSDGTVASWASAVELPDWSTWGNIYPRSGWIAQPDEVKNRALAAFRATHVATRTGQAHLYNYAEPKPPRDDMLVWSPEPLTANDRRTGSWQMLSPKKTGECSLLQDSPINSGVVNTRDPAMTSESGQYIFNVWRQYQCCNKPSSSGFKVYLDTIPVRIRII